MGPRSNENYAAEKDALVTLSREECVSDMGLSAKDVATKDVKIKLDMEECAVGMVGVKLCNTERCTNHSKRGGLCMRHGLQIQLRLRVKALH
mmetsp:Transcript_19036/g.28742  ORF Transcript_19036/g.28742 Transcript_19036/m.28742 type:complete len:92 (+) Transcript_19036:359-634(+)